MHTSWGADQETLLHLYRSLIRSKLAIDVARRSKKKNFVIFSDSMSSLQSINCFNLESDLVQKFLKDYTVLAKNGKNIILCWIPSHVGILGNEKADAAAKSALSLPVTRMKLPATGMYPRITKLIFDDRVLYRNSWQGGCWKLMGGCWYRERKNFFTHPP